MLMRLNFNKWVFDLDPRKSNVIWRPDRVHCDTQAHQWMAATRPQLLHVFGRGKILTPDRRGTTLPCSGSRSQQCIHKCLRCSRLLHRRNTATRLRIVPLYSHGFG